MQAKPFYVAVLGALALCGCTPPAPPAATPTQAARDNKYVCLYGGQPYSIGAELNGLVCNYPNEGAFYPDDSPARPAPIWHPATPRSRG